MPNWLSSSETLRQNTLCAGYRGGFAQLWPRLEDLGHCSVLTRDCLLHCKENKANKQKIGVTKDHVKLHMFQTSHVHTIRFEILGPSCGSYVSLHISLLN